MPVSNDFSGAYNVIPFNPSPAPPPQHWPDLIPLTQEGEDLPEFPLDALPEKILGYVQAVSAFTQSHADMAAMMAIGALAIALQGKVCVEGCPGYTEPVNLYVLICARPSERKSAVLSHMTEVITQYEADNNIRMIATDATPEALTSQMSKNNNVMAIASAEGDSLDMMAGRYTSAPNMDIYLKAYSGDPIRVDRIKRESEQINRPTLSMVVAGQPEVLQTMMANRVFAGRGLLARFLYCQPRSLIGTRRFGAAPIPAKTKEDYYALMTHLLDLQMLEDPRVIMLSQKALELFTNYYDSIERTLPDLESGIMEWAGKHPGGVLRISGLLHCAKTSDPSLPISENTMADAIAIGRYLMAQALHVFAAAAETREVADAKYILSKICSKKICVCKRSELYQCARSRFEHTEKMIPVLELLQDHGYIHIQPPEQDNSGRPGRKKDHMIYVNPAVHRKTN